MKKHETELDQKGRKNGVLNNLDFHGVRTKAMRSVKSYGSSSKTP